MEDHQIQKTRTGLDRIVRAFDISMKGLRAAWLEKAFRQEVALSVVLVPLALFLGRSWVETMMMLLSVGLVLFMLNLAALSMGISNGFWNWLALSTHVEMLLRGLVSSADLVWFALVAAVALTLAIHRLSTDKERG